MTELSKQETIPKLILHFRKMYEIMNTRHNRDVVMHGDNVKLRKPFIPILYDIVPNIHKCNESGDDKNTHVMARAYYATGKLKKKVN